MSQGSKYQIFAAIAGIIGSIIVAVILSVSGYFLKDKENIIFKAKTDPMSGAMSMNFVPTESFLKRLEAMKNDAQESDDVKMQVSAYLSNKDTILYQRKLEDIQCRYWLQIKNEGKKVAKSANFNFSVSDNWIAPAIARNRYNAITYEADLSKLRSTSERQLVGDIYPQEEKNYFYFTKDGCDNDIDIYKNHKVSNLNLSYDDGHVVPDLNLDIPVLDKMALTYGTIWIAVVILFLSNIITSVIGYIIFRLRRKNNLPTNGRAVDNHEPNGSSEVRIEVSPP